MMRRHGFAAAFALALMAGCASVPRPSVVAEAGRVSDSPAAREAKLLAPGAFAHAEKLRREAEAAFDDGDHAGAQILAERSIAAYAHAGALARLARSIDASAKAEAELAKAGAELATLEADHARVQAEVDALELKVRVARDAQPIVPSRRADPERERARLAAARALALQAQLLCSGARMLVAAGPAEAATKASTIPGDAAIAPSDAVKEAQGSLDQLTALLASSPPAAPIDQAARARASCLAALTSVRRAKAPVATAPGSGDALLAELSAAGALPSRDDRGVVVTLRDGDKSKISAALSRAAEAQLTELGRVAAAHPAFPVLVVVHLDKDGKTERELAHAHAEAVTRVLAAAHAPKVEVVVAGAVTPVVDPGGRHRARNARTEVVFVTPEVL
jgi:outer membrane protein OmpA-like peptidoglycan-associated protein